MVDTQGTEIQSSMTAHYTDPPRVGATTILCNLRNKKSSNKKRELVGLGVESQEILVEQENKEATAESR